MIFAIKYYILKLNFTFRIKIRNITGGIMKKAFTLAEVLITLGIIGVVAALTIPNLISHYQKEKTVTQLKKNFSLANQAIMLAVADHGDYLGWESVDEIGENAYFDKYWKPYFKGITLCTNKNICQYEQRGGNLSSFYYLNGNESRITAVYGGRSTIMLPDGTILINFSSYATSKVSWFYIDINGTEKPNTYGKDVFIFEKNEKGLLEPRCNNYTKEQVNQNCSKSGTGECCAKRIMNDNWKITQNYPW